METNIANIEIGTVISLMQLGETRAFEVTDIQDGKYELSNRLQKSFWVTIDYIKLTLTKNNDAQIENLQSQIASLEKRINSVTQKIGTDPTTILLSARKINELQEELAQVQIYRRFVKVFETNSNFEEQLRCLLSEILDTNGHSSTCLAQNAIAYYQMIGKKAAYSYLSSKEFKTAK